MYFIWYIMGFLVESGYSKAFWRFRGASMRWDCIQQYICTCIIHTVDGNPLIADLECAGLG
jgi:hypothetical protein